MIDLLFKDASSAKAFPLRLVYNLQPSAHAHSDEQSKSAIQLGVVASKRTFKKAPDRNHVKRRMREAIRLHKTPLSRWLKNEDLRIEGMLIFTGRDLPKQQQITKAWCKLLRRINADIFSS